MEVFGAFAQTLLFKSSTLIYIGSIEKWILHKQGTPVSAYHGLLKSNNLDRVYNVGQNKCFYLRLLLVNVTGLLSFQDIRKINGQQYPTHKDV